MTRLNAGDLRDLLACVQDLYRDPDLHTFPVKALACVRALVPSDWAAYEELNEASGRIVGMTDPVEARPGPDGIAVFMEHVHEHPLIERFTKTDDRRSRTISDFVSRAKYERTGLYNEFYKGMRTGDQLGLFVNAPQPLTIMMAASRARRTFTGRDRAIFDALQPHMLSAYRNAEAIGGVAAGGSRWAVEAIEAAGQGVVWLSRGWRVLASTAQARRWLAAYRPAGDRSTGDALPDALRHWFERSTALHDARDGGGGRGADDLARTTPTFRARGAGGELHVRLVPERRGEGYILLMNERINAADKGDAPPELAALAPRYRRVLDELLAGRSEKEAAAKLGLTSNTIHEYVKHIYATLGVGSRAELLARWIGRGPST